MTTTPAPCRSTTTNGWLRVRSSHSAPIDGRCLDCGQRIPEPVREPKPATV